MADHTVKWADQPTNNKRLDAQYIRQIIPSLAIYHHYFSIIMLFVLRTFFTCPDQSIFISISGKRAHGGVRWGKFSQKLGWGDSIRNLIFLSLLLLSLWAGLAYYCR